MLNRLFLILFCILFSVGMAHGEGDMLLLGAGGPPGTTFEDPSSLSGLEAWWDAEDGRTEDVSGVLLWEGKSTNALTWDNSSVGLIGARPDYVAAALNSHGVMRFTPSHYMRGSFSPLRFERTDSFTIFIVMTPHDVSGDRPVFGNCRNPAGTYRGWCLNLVNGKLWFRVVNTVDTNELRVQDPTSLVNNTSYYYTATYDGTSLPGGVSMLRSGASVTEGTLVNNLSATSVHTDDHNVGTLLQSYGAYFDGDIVNFGVYSRKLSDSELTSLNSWMATRYGL